MAMKKETKRQRFESLRGQLDSERSSFMSHWRDLGDFVLPRRPRFTTNDSNKGDRRNQKIIDSTATLASRTLASGMMSGVTSPARPWFRLTTADSRFSETGPVKSWLHEVTQIMTTMFHKSNLYNVLPTVYGDIGTFGTAAMYCEEDFENGMRFYSFPVGSYYIANDERLQVKVFMREFRMTVRQIVNKYGLKEDGKIDWKNISLQVKDLYEAGQTEQWIEIAHVIEPNPEHNKDRLEAKYKKFSSCYYERGSSSNGSGAYGSSNDEDTYLSESGYDYFPILCPRWETTGEDAYGTNSPGMTALGDIKALQLMQKRKSQAIEKQVNPPMTAPVSLRNQPSTIIPGGVTYVDAGSGQQGFRPAHEVNINLQHLVEDIRDHQNRIRRAYFEDLFLMLASMDRRQITAREIDERHEEKLLALGPVLEQLNQDLLDPVIDICFDVGVAQNRFPEPPQELQGLNLKVEYLSIMAQAQKLTGVAGVERFLGFAQQIVAGHPESADKLDFDQALDIYGDMLSVPPGLIRSDEDVAGIRAGREEAMAAEQERQAGMTQIAAAKELSQTPMAEGTALSAMMDQANAGALVN